MEKIEASGNNESFIQASADKNSLIMRKDQNFIEALGQAIQGLSYLSETDAVIQSFVGKTADSVNKETLLNQINQRVDAQIIEESFEDFFIKLTTTQGWFGEEERKMTEKFVKLQELLQQNLKDLKVFKIGKSEIDIYVVGLDSENVLTGIQTTAVET